MSHEYTPDFYFPDNIIDKEGVLEQIEEEKAMLERDRLSYANRLLRIASLEEQLRD